VDQRRVFQDWVMHECCRRADDLGWPHQIHVGTHNVPDSDPSPLEALARRYGRQNLVMLHGWPFVNEVADLAQRWPNVFIDACWLVVLDRAYFREAMLSWLDMVPLNKVMLGNDGTTIEMAVGSSLIAREILEEIRVQRRRAADLLHNNAVSLYGIGRPFEP
jgi:predicted TIM-barrel fold metal-dependent hydrolase